MVGEAEKNSAANSRVAYDRAALCNRSSMANIPAEDLLTLANEATSPHERRELLRQCGETLLALGRFAQAETIFRDLRAESAAAGSDEIARVESQLALIRKKRSEAPQLTARFDQVLIGSGHMIDAPDRKTPRFPASKAESVRAEIARQLAEWGIGADDLAICGGACGADILFAEECLKRGAQLRLFLSQEVDEFVRDSVQNGGAEWVQRFQSCASMPRWPRSSRVLAKRRRVFQSTRGPTCG